MVRKIHKTKTLYTILTAAFAGLLLMPPVNAEEVELQVNIAEVLSVSVTIPDSWAAGDVDATNGSALLRNKIVLSVLSNSMAGFTASMASEDTTNLVHNKKSTSIIPTLQSTVTASNFPLNYWGYSINDNDSGNTGASYNALKTDAITLASRDDTSSYEQDIFFGAKADITKDSGTYTNTVVFSVVSGVVTP